MLYIQHCKAEAWDRATGLSPIPPIALVHGIYNQLMSRDDADAQSRSQYSFFYFGRKLRLKLITTVPAQSSIPYRYVVGTYTSNVRL